MRSKLAMDLSVPPYVIFHDKTLVAMAIHRPTSATKFLELSGVGTTKLERFGEAFMAVLRTGKTETESES